MRKKYLSALLFGALLFASAGTFTSCKDYDDDINNLQEQINTINTTLSELKNQIGTAGVSSVTFDEATGVLTVVDGKGTNSYKIATSASAMVEAEIKDGKLYINDEEIGAVVGEVTVKDGKLMVDGKEVASLGGESSVVLVKNEDTQTCTLTVGDQTVTLPLNADANVAAEVSFGQITDFENITWSTASAASTDWKGPKGNVAKDQLLVGYIGTVGVSVSPYTYDLGAQTLKLVDTEGKEAPVNVTATPNVVATAGTPATGDSRAASVDGQWDLSIEMKEDVTAANIADAFVSGKKFVLYALEVNGKVVSPYTIQIEPKAKAAAATDDDAKAEAKYVAYGDYTGDKGIVLVPGETYELAYTAADAYDSYITFEGKAADMAKKYSIEPNGMKVTIPSDAPNNLSITGTIHVMNVDGKVIEENTFTITTVAQEVVTPVGGLKSEYTLTDKVVENVEQAKLIKLDVTGVFEFDDVALLTADEAYKNFKLAVTSENVKEFFYYYEEGKESDNTFKSNKGELTVEGISLIKVVNNEEKTWNPSTDAISDLKYIQFAVNNGEETDEYKYNADSKAGTYDLTATLTNNGNEVRKFTNELKVTIPSVDEFVTKSAAWSGNTVSMNVSYSSSAFNGNMMSVYSMKDGAKGELSFIFNSNNNPKEGFETTVFDSERNFENAGASPIDVTWNTDAVQSGIILPEKLNGYNKYSSFQVKSGKEFALSGGAIKESKTGNEQWYLQPITFTTVYDLNGVEIKSAANTMNIVNPAAGNKFVYLNEFGQETEAVLTSDDKLTLGARKDNSSTYTTVDAEIKAAQAAFAKDGVDSDVKTNEGLYLLKADGTYVSFTGDNTIDVNGQSSKYEISISSKEATGESAAVKSGVVDPVDGTSTGSIEFEKLSAGAYSFTIKLVDTNSMGNQINSKDVRYDSSITVSKK